MTTSSDDAVQTLQRDVQRLLGRCLLRLQQYERLAKTILAHHDISGSVHAMESVRDTRVANTGVRTLGMLVRELLGSYAFVDTTHEIAEPTIELPDDTASFRVRINLGLTDADYARTESEMKELVRLRNDLVHHFLDRYDLWNLQGCRCAQEALQAAYIRIDQHFDTLRGWAEDMEQAQRTMAGLLQSDEFRELVINGNAPDDGISPMAQSIGLTHVVCALREAARALAVDGWAHVGEAAKWIAKRYPEQVPSKYGCKSWRQVLHEARSFEIRYFDSNGKRSAWYRGREVHDRRPGRTSTNTI